MRLTNLSHGDLPTSYLFVEAAVTSGLLNENTNQRLGKVMQAAIARLQTMLTPGAASDLEALLGFFAPKGGGLKKVKEMVSKAGAIQVPLEQDRNWWQELFTVFNVIDQTAQQQIMTQAVRNGGGAPGQTQQSQPHPSRPELTKRLAQNTDARAQSLAKIQDLRAKIAALRAKQGGQAGGSGLAEEVFNQLARQLLAEADIKSNLRFVASNLMRRLGYASTTPVQEANWLERFAISLNRPVEEGFSDFFRNMRSLAANPDQLQAKAENSELRSYNERIAKLAINLLSDHITQEMNNRLQVANLTVKDLITAVAEWQRFQADYRKANGQVSDEFRQQFQAAYDKMQRVIYAIDPNLAKGQP